MGNIVDSHVNQPNQFINLLLANTEETPVQDEPVMDHQACFQNNLSPPRNNVFLQVPNCVQIRIFEHLDVKSICRSGRVARSWNGLSKNESLWRTKWRSLFNEHENISLIYPSWRQAVICSYRVYLSFPNDKELLMWAVKNRFESMAMHIAVHNPLLVQSAPAQEEHPLCSAITVGSVKMMKLFLRLGASPTTNITTHRTNSIEQNHTPMYLASARGDIKMVKLLLRFGASIDEVQQHGYKAIHVAANFGHIELLKYLKSLDANINSTCKTHDSTPIYRAAFSGQVEMVKLLLDLGANVNSDDIKFSPLYAAAMKDKLKCLKLLVSRGAIINDSINGCAALHIAASNGHLQCLETLLDAGAQIETTTIGLNPLYAACGNNRRDIVDALLKRGASANRIFNNGSTCLYWAAECGHAEIVHKLLMRGANVESVLGGNITALQRAADNKGNIDVCKVLLDYNANVNYVSSTGHTPLHFVCDDGRLDIAELLLSRGGLPDIKSKKAISPLQLAVKNGAKSVIAAFNKAIEERQHQFDSNRNNPSWFS